jgi:DNA gyrase subunit A
MRLGQLTRLSRIDIEQRLEKARADRRPRVHPQRRRPPADRHQDDLLAIKEQFATPRVAAVMLDEGEMTDLDLVDDKEWWS